MVKIKDVARAAGVSVATVSRTLSGSPRVRAATRQRVLAAVSQLNYRPDEVARSLRRRRTNLIGLIVSTVENRFFTEVAHAAEQAAHERGYQLIVCNTDEDPAQEQTYLQLLDRQMAAGVILAPAPGEGAHLAEYIAADLPMVLINRRLDHLPLPSITSDDEQAARECVTVLIQGGKRRVAAIKGLPNITTTQDRLAGYRQALAAAGLAVEPGDEAEGCATLEGGYRAARRLLTRPDPPDALFAFNNLMVQGAVIALHDLGLRWPDDVDVAGFGAFGCPLGAARLYRPPLTLIRQPTHQMGRVAVAILADRLEGKTIAPREFPPLGAAQQVVLKNRVIRRQEWLSLPWDERPLTVGC
jgi:DNA-binding LacI/PurR family transcriptional regulator